MSSNLRLHHVNIPSSNVDEMARFYETTLGLEPFQVERVGGPSTRFMMAGNGEVHLIAPDPGLLFRNGMAVNPLLRGHVAFRTDDIDGFKARLASAGVAYADYGEWAVKGWQQIFFYDPEGNVIEVHRAEESHNPTQTE